MKSIKKFFLKYKNILNYIIAGILTTIVSLGSYYFSVSTFLNPEDAFQLQCANIISWVCAVSFAYFVNRKFVFESKDRKWIIECLRFFSARISTLLLDMFFMALFVSVMKINDKVAKVANQFIIFILNYILSKFFVFNK